MSKQVDSEDGVRIENNENLENNVDNGNSESNENIEHLEDSVDMDTVETVDNVDLANLKVPILITVVSLIIGIFSVLIYFTVIPNVRNFSSNVSESQPIAYNSTMNEDGKSFKAVSFLDNQSQHAFIFSNDSGINSSTKVVDIYITLDGVKSLEFLMSNYYALENELSFNNDALVVNVIDSGSVSSDVLVTALGYSFDSAPEKSWDFLGELIVISQRNKEERWSEDKLLDSVVKSAQELGIDSINKEKLLNPVFNDWLYEYNEDKVNKVGSYIPNIFIDGNMISFGNIYDSEEIMGKIRSSE